MLKRNEILSLILILLGTSFGYSQDQKHQVDLYDRLLKNGLTGQGYDVISTLPFDTLIDTQNPDRIIEFYKSETGQIIRHVSGNIDYRYAYDENNCLRKEQVRKPHERYSLTYDNYGELIHKIHQSDNHYIVEEHVGDTMMLTYFNVNGDTVKHSVSIKDSLLVNETNKMISEINFTNWCGLPFHQMIFNNRSYTTILKIDSVNYEVKIATQYFNGNRLQMTHKRLCDEQQDLIEKLLLNQTGDTLEINRTIQKMAPYIPSMSAVSKIIEYHPNNPDLYRKAVYQYDKNEGYTIGIKWYNAQGELESIEHYEYGGGCGVPSVKYEYFYSERKKIESYYNAKDFKVSGHLLNHPKFNYTDYQRLNGQAGTRMTYLSKYNAFNCEYLDELVMDNQHMTLQAWRDAFLVYLFDQNIKPFRNTRTYTVKFTFEKGWHIQGYGRSKVDRFMVAFMTFSNAFLPDDIVPKKQRGILLKSKEETVMIDYPIKGFKWQCHW